MNKHTHWKVNPNMVVWVNSTALMQSFRIICLFVYSVSCWFFSFSFILLIISLLSVYSVSCWFFSFSFLLLIISLLSDMIVSRHLLILIVFYFPEIERNGPKMNLNLRFLLFLQNVDIRLGRKCSGMKVNNCRNLLTLHIFEKILLRYWD